MNQSWHGWADARAGLVAAPWGHHAGLTHGHLPRQVPAENQHAGLTQDALHEQAPAENQRGGLTHGNLLHQAPAENHL